MSTKDELKNAMAVLLGEMKDEPDETMNARTAKNVGVEWTARKKIGLPIINNKRMTYSQARDVLHRIERDEETVIETSYTFAAWPLDAARALSLAIEEVYGLMDMKRKMSFFSVSFPQLIQVEVGEGKTESVPWGSFELPGLQAGFEMFPHFTPEPHLVLAVEMAKKTESEVNALVERVRDVLRERSIYRGQAIKIDLEFMRNFDPRHFDPTTYLPTFMRLAGHHENELITTPDVEAALEQSLWARIELPDALRQNGASIKHGLLLEGPYGVGKSLLALVTAIRATRAGWTFVYLKDSRDIVNALKMVRPYAPVVLFAEDVDQLMPDTKSDRPSPEVQAVSTALDGIDNKDEEIIVVLTTNRPEVLYNGLLRAGRIGTAIHMDAPDAQTAGKFITRFGGSLLAESVQGEELESVAQELAGYPPAFIREAIEKAKIAAIYRTKSADIEGLVTGVDLVNAARMLKNHAEMAKPRQKAQASPTEAHEAHLVERIAKAVHNGHSE